MKKARAVNPDAMLAYPAWHKESEGGDMRAEI